MFKNPVLILTALAAVMCQAGSASGQDSDDPFIYPQKADYPKVPLSGKTSTDFVPRHWKIMGKAEGDLNGDKEKDIALVVTGQSKRFKQKNTNLGEEIFDTNPRMLIVLFKDPRSGGYTLAEKSSTIIPIPDSPTAQEPFDGISIQEGILNLKFVVWYSAGTWYTSNSTYKFRYQDKHFVLIGADKTELQRNSGQETESSYNFLTGKLKVTSGSMADDKAKFAVKWLTIHHNKLRAMSAFKKLYEWNLEGSCL